MIDDSIYRELYSIFNRYNPNHIEVDDCNIFHYTSPSALNAILSNHTIRFTDRNYLNDYSEGRYTMELCLKSRFELKLPFKYRDYFKKYCKQLYEPPLKKKLHIYQCSFSIEPDNLSLWNYYTKNDGIKGYNLGFKSIELSNKLLTNVDLSNKNRIEVIHGKVVYSEEKQKKYIREIISDFAKIIKDNEYMN